MSALQLPGGRRIHYDDLGTGPAVLLLAGRGWPRTSWQPLIAALAPRFRVIAIDNRDAGESVPEIVPYTMADLGDDAAAALRALGVVRAAAIGHSMGGMIALQLALAHPDLVDRLVLVATTAGGWSPRALAFYQQPPDPWIADPVARMRANYAEMLPPAFREAHADALAGLAALAQGNRLTLAGYMRHNGAIASHDRAADLDRIAVPALVIHGDRDAWIPIRRGQALAEGIPDAQFLRLPDTGHLPQIERADEVTRAILDFLGAENQQG